MGVAEARELPDYLRFSERQATSGEPRLHKKCRAPALVAARIMSLGDGDDDDNDIEAIL